MLSLFFLGALSRQLFAKVQFRLPELPTYTAQSSLLRFWSPDEDDYQLSIENPRQPDFSWTQGIKEKDLLKLSPMTPFHVDLTSEEKEMIFAHLRNLRSFLHENSSLKLSDFRAGGLHTPLGHLELLLGPNFSRYVMSWVFAGLNDKEIESLMGLRNDTNLQVIHRMGTFYDKDGSRYPIRDESYIHFEKGLPAFIRSEWDEVNSQVFGNATIASDSEKKYWEYIFSHPLSFYFSKVRGLIDSKERPGVNLNFLDELISEDNSLSPQRRMFLATENLSTAEIESVISWMDLTLYSDQPAVTSSLELKHPNFISPDRQKNRVIRLMRLARNPKSAGSLRREFFLLAQSLYVAGYQDAILIADCDEKAFEVYHQLFFPQAQTQKLGANSFAFVQPVNDFILHMKAQQIPKTAIQFPNYLNRGIMQKALYDHTAQNHCLQSLINAL